MDDPSGPFKRWAEGRKVDPGPAPDRDLGRNLESFEDVAAWLSHPTNWFGGDMYIVKWDGYVPTIAKNHAWQLAPGSYCRDMMLKVVLTEHQRRKRGGFKEADVHQGDLEDV